MKPNAKKRSANKSGAVLVTAVVVLLVMSILMTATIGHVAVNRRKTNSNYSHKQAYLTASTTLKSFVAEIRDITSAPTDASDAAAVAKQIANINALKQLAQANEGKGTKKQVTYNGNDGTDYKLGSTELEIKTENGNADKLIITAYTTYGGETEKVAAHISTEVFKEPAKFTNTIEEISTSNMYLNNLKVVGDTAILDKTNKMKKYYCRNDVDLQGSLFIWGSVDRGTANSSFRLHQNLRNKSIGSFVQISENLYGKLLISSNMDRADGYNYIYVNGTTYSGHAEIGTSAHEVDLITHGVDQRRPSEVSESDWSQGDWTVYGNIYCYNSDTKLNPEGRKGDFIAARPNITVNGSVYIEGDLDVSGTNNFTVTKELHVKGNITGGKSKIHCSTIKEGSEAEIDKTGRGAEPTMEYKAEDYKYMPEDFFMNNDGVSSDTFRTKYLSFYDSTKDLDMFDDFKEYKTPEGAKFNYHLDSKKDQNCYYIQSYTANKRSPANAVNAAGVPVGSSRTVLVDVTDDSGDVVIMLKNGTIIDANNPVEIVVRNLSKTKDVKDAETGKTTKQHTYNCYFVSDSGDKIQFTGKDDNGVSQHTGSQKGFFDSTKLYIYDYDTFIKMYNSTYYSDSNRNIAECGKEKDGKPININPNFYYNPTSDASLNGNKGGKTVYGPSYSGIIFLMGEGFDFGPSYKGGDPSNNGSWDHHGAPDNNGGFLQISFYGPQACFGINCQSLKLKVIDSNGDLYDVGDKYVLGVGVFVANVVNAGQTSYFYYTEPSHTSILTNAKGEKGKEISGFTLDRYDHY
ncbi:MAG: hypothetical protein ILA24_01230 [Ruminococcus sp.]|nr:hypothetical protein [Ruminococcus sp.]